MYTEHSLRQQRSRVTRVRRGSKSLDPKSPRPCHVVGARWFAVWSGGQQWWSIVLRVEVGLLDRELEEGFQVLAGSSRSQQESRSEVIAKQVPVYMVEQREGLEPKSLDIEAKR
ncbi:hypothetical protein VTJ04DRAFT_6140 [Mycothermus thermophilus]|uniref:uncharacterized protein n=1 Tax=Humicola insolens TaxID=85995 RepID=UPI0037437815